MADYVVIQADNIADLQTAVVVKLTAGYTLVGGVVIYRAGKVFYAQALQHS